MVRKALFILFAAVCVWIAGCSRPWTANGGLAVLPTLQPDAMPALPVGPSVTPLVIPTQVSTPVSATIPASLPNPEPTQTARPPEGQIWFAPGVPAEVRQGILSSLGLQLAASEAQAGLKVGAGLGKQQLALWVYALAAPFPTLEDGVSLADLKLLWQGKPGKSLDGHALVLAPDTRAVFEKQWGPAGAGVRSLPAADLAAAAWKEKTTWAILPFEEIQPRWKVLRVDGQSPLDREFQPSGYGLRASFGIQGDAAVLERLSGVVTRLAASPITNRDPGRLTVLVMTGTTALVRGSAWYMQQKGMLFPGTEIRAWLRSADITHISNEASFNPKCPNPDPNDPNLRFCSQPQYIKLLEDVGTDIVELTGNHLNDFGAEWLAYSIDMFKQRNWLYYGGGVNQEQARKAVTLEHNGNKLAFIGCNPAGPKGDWATATQPGTADCDYPNMGYLEAEVRRLKAEGYQVIVTFQFFESVDPRPLPIHYRDFRRMADAGAIIVSGSQAHLPQAMEIRNQGFIHYGVSNLFFDQMDTYWPDTKDEFIDRHVFYDGKYLGVELLTARLIEYVKPRPMTAGEREVLLRRIFEVSGWPQSSPTEWRVLP